MSSEVITKTSCKNCGAELPNDHSGPCPKCGKTGRNIKAEFFEKITIKDSLSWEHRREFIKKNPIIILICIIITFGAPVLGFFLSGLVGVIIGIILGFGVSILGLFAVMKIREIYHGGS
jgi:hypothetical protein